MVLSLDDSVGCAAFAGDVARKNASQYQLDLFQCPRAARRSRMYVQVDKFSLIVFHVGGICAVWIKGH